MSSIQSSSLYDWWDFVHQGHTDSKTRFDSSHMYFLPWNYRRKSDPDILSNSMVYILGDHAFTVRIIWQPWCGSRHHDFLRLMRLDWGIATMTNWSWKGTNAFEAVPVIAAKPDRQIIIMCRRKAAVWVQKLAFLSTPADFGTSTCPLLNSVHGRIACVLKEIRDARVGYSETNYEFAAWHIPFCPPYRHRFKTTGDTWIGSNLRRRRPSCIHQIENVWEQKQVIAMAFAFYLWTIHISCRRFARCSTW